MSTQYKFECRYCGKEYGDNVIELALHIGRVHDIAREIDENPHTLTRNEMWK